MPLWTHGHNSSHLDAHSYSYNCTHSPSNSSSKHQRSAQPCAPRVCQPVALPLSSPISTTTESLFLHTSRVPSPLLRGTRPLSDLTHVDAEGNAHMVDVGTKRPQRRTAIARSRVCVSDRVARVLTEESGVVAKGNVLQVAQLAGICGAKHTATLIPLCHNIPLDSVDVRAVLAEGGREVMVLARARTTGVTGVEMEAMTAASVAALTVYDMLKALDKGIVIADTRLLLKSGGKSGLYVPPSTNEDQEIADDMHGGDGARAQASQLGLPPELPLAWVEDVVAGQ